MDSKTPDVDALRRLYTDNQVAKAFFDHAARRERDQSETKVDRILVRLRADGHDFRRREIIDLFRKMQDQGLGQFVEGRRGWQSRFVWSTGLTSVGRAAVGEPQTIEHISSEDGVVDGNHRNIDQSDIDRPTDTNDRTENSEGEEMGEVGGTGLEEELEDDANYLVDNHSCVIVGVQATAARMSQERVAAQDMITRFVQWQGREPGSVAADATYGNGEFLQWLLDRGITPYMRTRDSALRKNNPGYGPERFTYLPESNSYRCPAGEQLNYVGLNVRNRAHAYIGSAKRCGACSQKAQCTTGRYKYLAIHIHESARQRARELANTPEFSTAQRQRKKVEALFAELKHQIGLRRLRLRRMKFVREQFFLAAAAQNIKRLVRFLSQPTVRLAVTA